MAQYWQDGTEHQATLTISVPPAALDDTVTPQAPKVPGNLSLTGLGLAVSLKPSAGGVPVVAVTGPSAKAGIVAGDLIEQISGQTVATAADLQKQVQELATAQVPVAVLLVSGDMANGADPGPRWVPVAFKK